MSNSPKLRPFTRRVSTHGGGVRRKLRRMTYWKTLFVSAIAAVACGSSNVAIPTCSGNQVCAESFAWAGLPAELRPYGRKRLR
jgi:hypothetical protein